MDNITYDELNLTFINTDETYSRLRTTQTKINPSYELQRRVSTDQTATKEIQQNTHSSNNTKFSTVMIIMMMILLLITLISIVLSVITFSQLSSEQSKVVIQPNNTTESALTSQLDTIQTNLFQSVMELVEMQLITAQGNICQKFNMLDAKLESSISLLTQYLSVQTQENCGSGLWHRLVYLNMSDPSQQCPSAWREYNISGVKACGRPDNSHGSCEAISYSTGQTYSRVCGRVIGYQYASPDAFNKHANNHIDLDGVSITYAMQQNHIWSYVAGFTQSIQSQSTAKCPCSNDNEQGTDPPSYIGSNYYCESGNPDSGFRYDLYNNDPLWDGQQCEGTCCNGTMSPPWFSVQLPAPTTDTIEVSICCDQGTDDEDVPVELIEIYVQ